MNKFEQLIEYVINDEEQKARELFHDIVVEKSRQIYEDIMAEEEIEEAQHDDLEEAEDLEEADDIEEDAMVMDAQDQLIDQIETEESQDISMEGDDGDDGDDGKGFSGMDDGDDGGSDAPATKDDIMNLEDKLDQLMADFESIMGDGGSGDGDDFGSKEGGDAIEMDDTGEMMPMAEAVTLKAAPKPVTSEEGSVNKKSTVAANAGAKGPIGSTVKPVHTGGEGGGHHDTAAYRNTTKDLISDFQNKAGASMKDQKPATKPQLGQATGVNNKSVVPGKHN